MKNLLATVCLFLIGSLTASVFSLGIHKSLFPVGECAHSKTKAPCSDHGDIHRTKRNWTLCGYLFGKSVDAAVELSVSRPSLFWKNFFFYQGVETPENFDRWAQASFWINIFVQFHGFLKQFGSLTFP